MMHEQADDKAGILELRLKASLVVLSARATRLPRRPSGTVEASVFALPRLFSNHRSP